MANIANVVNSTPQVLPDALTKAMLPDDAPELPLLNASAPPPDTGHPMLAKAVYKPDALQQNIDNDTQQLQKVRFNQANPYGSENNHPGTLGKIAHVLSVAGNIAGNIVAPGVMANIPGSQLNMGLQEGHLAHRLNAEQQEESQNKERDALTAKTQEETSEAPGKTAEGNKLIESEIGKNEAQTNALENPAEKYTFQQTDHGLLRINPKTGEAQPVTLNGVPIGPKQTLHYETVTGPDGKPHTYGLDEKGDKVVDEGQHYEKPTQGPAITMVVPDGQGGGTVERLAPGSKVAPGSLTAAGFNQENVASNKATQAEQKARQDATKEYQLAQTLAQNPSPTNDLALVMRYIGATKPDSLGKLRLNQNEISLVMGTRSAFGDLQALVQKVQNGQMLTPNQRNDMLSTMKLLTGQSGSESAPGMIFARDPSGKLHQAPAGTALPAGWKEGR